MTMLEVRSMEDAAQEPRWYGTPVRDMLIAGIIAANGRRYPGPCAQPDDFRDMSTECLFALASSARGHVRQEVAS